MVAWVFKEIFLNSLILLAIICNFTTRRHDIRHYFGVLCQQKTIYKRPMFLYCSITRLCVLKHTRYNILKCFSTIVVYSISNSLLIIGIYFRSLDYAYGVCRLNLVLGRGWVIFCIPKSSKRSCKNHSFVRKHVLGVPNFQCIKMYVKMNSSISIYLDELIT